MEAATMRNTAHTMMAILFTFSLAGCATWGTHVKTAGTLAEYLTAECGDLEGKDQERCIADELGQWAECAAEDDADTDGAE